ncbi:MAG: hypothetical protein ACRELS_11160 [Candidatus Rokuibacteriota bacterium]
MSRVRARVYYTLLALVLVVPVAAACAQERSAGLSIEPVMAKGPVGAAVTIVEFSDYQ